MISVSTYCRVSTAKEDQANSFESQKTYFEQYIKGQPDWTLYEIYADEGITGTSTAKRAAFNRMIQEAHEGKFSLIITKEVSRFSRNILDTISFTRELKAAGVGVLFINDGINTLDPDAELRLSIMGSIAQEESRKTSSRVKWGQTRRMEQGVVFGRSMLGYHVEHGTMTIEPEGAEIIRKIFRMYVVELKGASVIAKELQWAGCKTFRGKKEWSASHILKILKNEKYVGDLVQKKTITPDYLTHAKKYNHGEEALVVLKNHHEPIIDREIWDQAQIEREKRNLHGKSTSGHGNRYLLSGKIKCGECGASFVARKRSRKDGTSYRRWGCYTAATRGSGSGCDIGKQLGEELALDMLSQVLTSLQLDTVQLTDQITTAVLAARARDQGPSAEFRNLLEEKKMQLNDKKERALDEFLSQHISEEEMRMMLTRYERELENAHVRQRQSEQERNRGDEIKRETRLYINRLMGGEAVSEILYKTILQEMTVFKERRINVKLNHLPCIWTFALEEKMKIMPS